MRQLILVMLVTLLLAACGGGDDESATSLPPTEAIASAATAIPTVEATMEVTPEATEEAINHGEYPCFNLPQDDCDLLIQAAENTANMTTFSQSSTLSVVVTGLAPLTLLVDIPAELTLDATSNGDFTVDTDDIPATLTLNLQASATADGEPALDLDVPATVIDGILYLALPQETVGVPFDMATINALNLPLDLGQILPLQELLTNDPANFGEFIFADQLGVLINPSGADIAPYSTLIRAEDSVWNGEAVQVFIYTLDVREMLNSDDFAAMIALTSGQAPDDPTLAFALQLLPVILEEVESRLVITQYVGVEDALVHRLTVDLDFTLNIGKLLTPSSPDANEPLIADVLFDVELTGINAEKSILTPQDVRILTASELQALLNTAEAALAESTPEATAETP